MKQLKLNSLIATTVLLALVGAVSADDCDKKGVPCPPPPDPCKPGKPCKSDAQASLEARILAPHMKLQKPQLAHPGLLQKEQLTIEPLSSRQPGVKNPR